MQPTIIEDVQSIAANTTVQNVIVSNTALRGLLNAPYPARIKLVVVASGYGLRVDALHGGSMYCSNIEPRFHTVVQEPVDILNENAYTQAQEQMVLRVTNTTAGALSLTYRLTLIPVVDESWNGAPVELPPDSVVMQGSQVITTLQTDVQLLDAKPFEQLSVPSMLTVLMTMSAIGLIRQLFIDQDRIAPPSTFSVANTMPGEPFDTTISNVEVPANKKQFLSVSNPTGGSLTVYWKTINAKLIRD